MAAPATGRNEFADLDQLIARSLVTLRQARAACTTASTPQNLDLRDRAEENLNSLLDFRSAARRRPAGGARSPGFDGADRLSA